MINQNFSTWKSKKNPELKIENRPDGIRVSHRDQDYFFSYVWLRDHCNCVECLHPQTFQRLFDTLKAYPNISPSKSQRTEEGIILGWQDGHTTFFSDSWLLKHSRNFMYEKYDPIIWGNEIQQQIPKVSVKQQLEEPLEVIKCVEKYGFVLIEGLPVDAQKTKEFIEKNFSFIRRTLYGDFWDFTANLAMADTAYTNLELKPHTDGCYFDDPPGIQIFHLLEFDGTGGETILVDGFKVAKDVKEKDFEAFNFLCKTPIPFHYVDKFHYLHSTHTIFGVDDNGNINRFTYNNDDRAPFYFHPKETKQCYEALRLVIEATRNQNNQFIFPMKPGTLVLIDNHRVLHGRLSFSGHRRLTGCYLNKEDFLSKGHVTRSKFIV